MKDLFQKGILVGIYFVCFILVLSIIAIVIVNVTTNTNKDEKENDYLPLPIIEKYYNVDLEPQNESTYYEIILPFWNITDEKVFSYVEKNITLEGNGTYEFIKYSPKDFIFCSVINETALLIKGTGKISFSTRFENNFSEGFFNLTLCADDHWTRYSNQFYWGFNLSSKSVYQHFNFTISDDQVTDPYSSFSHVMGYCNISAYYSSDTSIDYFIIIRNDYWITD